MTDISIHAPVKGATPQSVNYYARLADFNPRTREGCDGALIGDPQILFLISIHAPVKGATGNANYYRAHGLIFQSTHP